MDLLLSICIPTRGRNEIMQTTLESIYSSNVELSRFEVVIYDSSDDDELGAILLNQYPESNIVYKRGKNHGYLNLIEALKMGSGSYLKLHNDYSCFIPGSLALMIDEIKVTQHEKPLLLFSNDALKNKPQTYNSFNDFLYNISFYTSWSTLFGVWRTDFEKLKDIKPEPMFPHTSLLFAMTDKVSYKINNAVLFDNIVVKNKGGYNLFEVFSQTFIGMVKDCYKTGSISLKTFKHIKRDMLYNFFIYWYSETQILKNDYTFLLSGTKNAMTTHYSTKDYYTMIALGYIRSLKELIKRLKN